MLTAVPTAVACHICCKSLLIDQWSYMPTLAVTKPGAPSLAFDGTDSGGPVLERGYGFGHSDPPRLDR